MTDHSPTTEARRQVLEDSLVSHAMHRTGTALDHLVLLSDYYRTTRGVGHTTALIRGAQETMTLVLAANQAHRDELRNQGLSAECSSYLWHMKGHQFPLLVDHWALQRMIGEAQNRLLTVTADTVRHVIKQVTKSYLEHGSRALGGPNGE